MLMKTVSENRNRLNPVRVYRAIALVEKFVELQPDDVDEVLFNALLDTCCRLKDLRRLESTVQRMKDLNVAPSPVTLGILVKTYGQAGDLQKVLQVWNEMEVQREQANAVTYGCMIDACVKCGNLDKATEIFQGMRSRGKHRNTILYTTLIKGHGLGKDLSSALALFREMHREGVPYNTITYNSIIEACVKSGDLETGEELLREMLTPGNGVEPDLITFSTLLKGYCHVGELDKALQIIETIKSRGLKCDELVYNTLMDGCVKANDVTVGVGLFQEMVQQGLKPSAITHSILARLYQRAGYDEDSSGAVAQLYALLGIDRPCGGERGDRSKGQRQSLSCGGGASSQDQHGFVNSLSRGLHTEPSLPSTPLASPLNSAGRPQYGFETVQMFQMPSPQCSESACSPYSSPVSMSGAFSTCPSAPITSTSAPPALPPWPFPSRDGVAHFQAPSAYACASRDHAVIQTGPGQGALDMRQASPVSFFNSSSQAFF
jgi:pentatricopeptide repeat protein